MPPSVLLLETDDGSEFTGTWLFPRSRFSEEIPNFYCVPGTSHLFPHFEGRRGSAPAGILGQTVGWMEAADPRPKISDCDWRESVTELADICTQAKRSYFLG